MPILPKHGVFFSVLCMSAPRNQKPASTPKQLSASNQRIQAMAGQLHQYGMPLHRRQLWDAYEQSLAEVQVPTQPSYLAVLFSWHVIMHSEPVHLVKGCSRRLQGDAPNRM